MKSRLRSYINIIVTALCVVLWSGACIRTAVAEEEKKTVRKFNDVLYDLLNEFSYDLKTNQLQALKNVSIRKIALSETIPKTYQTYLESLVTERFRLHSKIRIIECTSCKIKRSAVENGKLVITSPINNPTELDALANQLGVDIWLDVALLYQESGMLLAFNAFDSKTKELIWTKTYNSEELYKRQLNPEAAAADGAQGPESLEPPSSYVVAISAGWHLVPNVNTYSNMLGLNLRMSEQFNYKRSEVGAMIAAVMDPKILVSNYTNVDSSVAAGTDGVTAATSDSKVKPFSFGVALYATYHHMFITLPENIEAMRWGLHIGLGGIYAPGYITITGRGGGILKFGRRFFLEFAGAYSMPTTLNIKDQFSYTTKGGVGADATFGVFF